jgi:hypothetical protein
MRAQRHTQKDGRGLEGALEGSEGSKAHSKKMVEGSKAYMVEGSKTRSKRGEGSKACSRRKRGLKSALEKERRAQRRARKEARAQRRARKKGRAQKRARKEVGLGNALPYISHLLLLFFLLYIHLFSY